MNELQDSICKPSFAVYVEQVADLPDRPAWLDPERDALLTPKRLAGLVHPIRVRILAMLQYDGPSTATALAKRVGQSSGVTSYHLRVLAELGFIVEDGELGTGRDRWWRAVHRSTSFTFRAPEDPASPDTVEDAERWLRIDADEAHRRMIAAIDTLSGQLDELPNLPWQINEWPLRLTRDEARALGWQVTELLQQYRREPGDPDPPPGTERAMFQFQILPDEADS